MCGRLAVYTPVDQILALLREWLPDLDTGASAEFRGGGNIAPTQPVLAIGRSAPERPHKFALIKWGFVPAYAAAQGPAPGGKAPLYPINARAETAASKPMFRSAFARRRCIIVANGFYTWGGDGPKKVPHYFAPAQGGMLGLAGIYEVSPRGEGEPPLITCAVLTTEANPTVAHIHDRMPAVLSPQNYAAWCDPGRGAENVQPLLIPYAGELTMQANAIPGR